VHAFTESTGALAMNDAHGGESLFLAGFEVVWKEVPDFVGPKSVQVQLPGDGEVDRSLWIEFEF
jgi:hypothetical protein